MNRLLLLLLISSSLFINACDYLKLSNNEPKKAEEIKKDTYYTCSMHPHIKEDKPGKCPICHMNLTKVEVEVEKTNADITGKKREAKEIWQCKDYPDVTSEKEDVCPIDGSPMVKKSISSGPAESIAKIKLKKSQMNHFKPSYFAATTMKMNKNIRLLGSVLESEERESNIPARIEGRVEKVYIKSTGSFVKVGEPVLDLYSPRLITAGEEYLIARRSYEKTKSKDFKGMLKQSEERLKLWGIRKFQYERWFRQSNVPKQITIHSPATGVVRKRNAVAGSYFKEGQNFFELSNLSEVWVEMDVYEQESTLVDIGQKVKLSFSALPKESYQGEIDFISPVLDPKSRTLKVRATISNKDGKLKPGMVAEASLELDLEGLPIVVPRSAIIDTGKRKVVWQKTGDRGFEAKVILTGYESEGYIEVVEGLEEGEEVVMDGNFLLDAQAQLFGGYEDFNTKEESTHQHH